MKPLLIIAALALLSGCASWHPVAAKSPRFQFTRPVSAKDMAAIKASAEEARQATKDFVWSPTP